LLLCTSPVDAHNIKWAVAIVEIRIVFFIIGTKPIHFMNAKSASAQHFLIAVHTTPVNCYFLQEYEITMAKFHKWPVEK
jgi:hypothetical protein